MGRIGLFWLAALLSLTGCKMSEQAAIDQAKVLVAKELKDPESAKFDALVFHQVEDKKGLRSGTLCGLVNSKNSFGGYTGNKRFVAPMGYRESGEVFIAYVNSEEGFYAEREENGKSYFENNMWSPKCK